VIAANEASALAEISNAISKQDGAIANLKIVNRQQDFMEVLIDVDVRDIGHLSKVIVGLRGLNAIKGVERATGG
jgi:GTP pyrophosphokinase